MKKVSQGKLNKRKKFYKRNRFSAKINLIKLLFII